MTDHERQHLDEQGYVVLHGVIDAGLLDGLRTRIHELFQEEGDRAGHEFRTEEHARRLANLVDKGDVFRRAIALRLPDPQSGCIRADGADLRVPLPSVEALWVRPPNGTIDPERSLRKLLGEKRTRDLVLLRNGDRVEGVVTGIDSGGSCNVAVDGKETLLPFGRVAAVAPRAVSSRGSRS